MGKFGSLVIFLNPINSNDLFDGETQMLANSLKFYHNFLKGNCPLIYGCKTTVVNKGNFSLSGHNFELNCMRDREMEVSTSALVDGIAECSNEKEAMEFMEQGELSVSTLLMHFANEFDPYDALSTPLYQTATFKQVDIQHVLKIAQGPPSYI